MNNNIMVELNLAPFFVPHKFPESWLAMQRGPRCGAMLKILGLFALSKVQVLGDLAWRWGCFLWMYQKIFFFSGLGKHLIQMDDEIRGSRVAA